jgi:hypothetical protein
MINAEGKKPNIKIRNTKNLLKAVNTNQGSSNHKYESSKKVSYFICLRVKY